MRVMSKESAETTDGSEKSESSESASGARGTSVGACVKVSVCVDVPFASGLKE